MYYDRSGKTEDFVHDRMTEFLRSIPSDDVLQIAKTSTSGLIRATTVDEAIAVILRYSDAVTLLNRRKIKTNYLADYLHSRQVRFSIPANKTTLSRHVLQHWGIDSKEYNFDEADEESPAVPVQNTRPQRQRHDSGVVTYNQGIADASIQVLPNVQLPSAEDTGQSLALQFVPWFYNMLNNQLDFNSNHFWPKCTLRLEIIGIEPSPIVREAYSGEDSCALLKSLVVAEQIHFNPNSLNGIGISGRINPHGLVEIIASGSAHRANSEFGWFDQMFSLLRDPQYENNFKILNTILRFRKGVNLASPSVSGCISFR